MDGKAIYEKFNTVLTNYAIDEIGILPYSPPVPLSHDNNYPLIVDEKAKLGIPVDCANKLFQYAHEIFMSTRRSGDDLDESKVAAMIDEASRCLVLINPDCYTAVNARKVLVSHGIVDPSEELNLLALIFTVPKHSRSSVAWYHRKWLLQAYPHLMEYKYELLLAQRAAEVYPKNYYAWNYRHWVVSKIPHDSFILLEHELQNMKQWIRMNVSDYSGMQHRQRCLIVMTQRHMLNDQENRDLCGVSRNDLWNRRKDSVYLPSKNSNEIIQLWRDEVLFTRDLILTYPGHETLWYHLRFVSFACRWYDINRSAYGLIDRSDSNNSASAIGTWSDQEGELAFVHHCIELEEKKGLVMPTNTTNASLQKKYALAYELWVSELDCKTANEMKKVTSRLSELVEETNYYHVHAETGQ
ncbi:196_t:CDS:2 [Paraglomus brasilianum]|uniref:196_t:CDS:1 n=1 Tax=Paraglomus brasilianum TaxID=144538 RepID=A0A9N9F8Q5_9GLOM|nr:196_t:CDS:2 [Paraglomus brasilianum]